MANFCLPKAQADEFLKRLRSGEINPDTLATMTSKERRAVFAKFMGDDAAKETNALFESKLLLKNQKQGMVTWAKKVGGLTKEARKDIISKINKLEKVLSPADETKFLNDLADKKMGIEDLTLEESKQIFDMAKEVENKRVAIPVKSPNFSQEKMEYGIALALFKRYMKEITVGREAFSVMPYIKNPLRIIEKLGGVLKSIFSTGDNSFFGRQGIMTLHNNPTLWAKMLGKSFQKMATVLKGEGLMKRTDAMLPIQARTWSRENALNERYSKMKLDIGIDAEEALPDPLPEKLFGIGRFFQATDVAFNGTSIESRADMADWLLEIAEKQGIDIDDVEELEGIGSLVNSMTGRGHLGRGEAIAGSVNKIFFSGKYLKSLFDTITAHSFNPKSTPFSRSQARKQLIRFMGQTAVFLAIYQKLQGEDSVEWDPRHANFGKIKVGDRWIEITGGLGAVMRLIARSVPTMHNGKWGTWVKEKNGKYRRLNKPEFGKRNTLDNFEDFFEGKTAPLTSILRDYWKGEDYNGKKVTVENVLKNNAGPISARQIMKFIETEENAEDIILYSLFELHGLSASD